jgi:ankyrin repeat protein
MRDLPRGTRRARLTRLLAVALTAGALAAAPARPGESAVADAVMRGDTASVRTLLRQGADVNEAQGDGMTALHWGAQRGDAATVRVLLAAGARTDVVTRNGNYTPLHLAARYGRADAVRALLDAGAAVTAVTSAGGATPLHFAASSGDSASVALIVARGGAVNARETAFQQTPLMWAAAANRAAAIRVLAARGADLEATSRVEDIPAKEKADRAFLMARSRRLQALKAAESPAPAPRPPVAPAPTATPTPTSATAAPSGNSDTRVTPTAGDRRERGPTYGDLVGNKGGLTALLFAARDGRTAAVEALLAAGADLNHASAGDRTTPLLMATINGHLDLAKALLDRGANPRLASEANATPLYAVVNVVWAPKAAYPNPVAQQQSRIGYLELMEALIAKGADVNARLSKHLWYMSYNFDQLSVNTAGATPFWRAAYATDLDAMKLLVRHGADPSLATYKPKGRNPGAEEPDSEGAVTDPSGLPPVPDNGPGVYPIHAATGAGYGEGFAANAHRHAPDGWLPTLRYLVEELKADVNARDFKGYTPLHNAATRGDNAMITYLLAKGANPHAVARTGQTTVDMANGPVQRVPPFLETIALLEKLGVKNNHKCKSC